VDLKPTLETYAKVQFQRGQQQKAIELIKKAIELSTDDYFKKHLKRMEAGDISAPIL
jgi:Flp pilus assembly protein TadD